jgi:hypothetical protein
MAPIEDLPSDVADLIDRFEREAGLLRERVGEEIQKIQEKADEETSLIRRKGEEKIQVKTIALIDQIKPLQESYLKNGRLDEALAIRDAIRQLRRVMMNARPDPGNLLSFQDRINQEFLFEVVGSLEGPLWGSDVYTLDSRLACAAIHAGVLAAGQKGVVCVAIQDTSDFASFEGTERHGMRSFPWGPYPVGFRVWKP